MTVHRKWLIKHSPMRWLRIHIALEERHVLKADLREKQDSRVWRKTVHENELALSSVHDSCSRSFVRLNVSGSHTNAARMRQIGPREKVIKSPGVTPCNNFYRLGWLKGHGYAIL